MFDKEKIQKLEAENIKLLDQLTQVANGTNKNVEQFVKALNDLHARIDKPSIIRNQEDLELLMVHMTKHQIDEVTVDGIVVKKSFHLVPDTEDEAKKKKQQQDLIGWAAD